MQADAKVNERFNITVGEFKGSLESLLEMVQKRKMHISDVSLARVADDYIEYAGSLEGVPSAETANFIVIAATLLLIKSRSLLPNLELSIEEEDSIKDLEDRLELYKIYKNANDLLVGHIHNTKHLCAPKAIKVERVGFAPPKGLNTAVLASTMQELLGNLPANIKKPQVDISEKVNIEDVMHSLLGRVEASMQQSFAELSGGSGSGKQEVLVSFLALLELLKDGVLLAEQEDEYGEIMITK